MMVPTTRIKDKFSKAAFGYDTLSYVQKPIAENILKGLLVQPNSVILDIGCGTGYLTQRIKEQFLKSTVIGLDVASGMLALAKTKSSGLNWVLADAAQLPFKSDAINCIVSNAAYQWVGDLNKAFKEVRRVLSPQGVFIAALFGYETCQELCEVLEEASGNKIRLYRLRKIDQVHDALFNSGLRNLKITREIVKQEFKDMLALMRWFKKIGAGHLMQEGFLGAEAFREASRLYQARFPTTQSVKSSFEIIHIYAQK